MNNMEHIRTKYRLPVKRGTVVRKGREIGKVVGTNGAHLRVRFAGEDEILTFHPFDLDYLSDDGSWIEGKKESQRYNEAWDRWNAQATKTN